MAQSMFNTHYGDRDDYINEAIRERKEAFYESECSNPPVDWLDYSNHPNGNPNDCFLCYNSHHFDNVKEFQFSEQDNLEVWTVFQCHDCQVDYELYLTLQADEEMEAYNESYQTSIEENEKIIIDKIRYYAETGLFPDNNMIFQKSGAYDKSCVFCVSSIKDADYPGSAIRLEVPQLASDQCIQGTILVCSDCSNEITNQLSILEGIEQHNQIATDHCKKCDTYYAIGKDEKEARQKQSTIGKYMCQNCAEHEGLVHQNRIATKSCMGATCIENRLYDTLIIDLLNVVDKIENFCGDCALEMAMDASKNRDMPAEAGFSDEDVVQSALVTKELIVNIYIENEKYYYQIIVCRNGIYALLKDSRSITPVYYYEKQWEAMFDGFEHGLKIKENGNQDPNQLNLFKQ